MDHVAALAREGALLVDAVRRAGPAAPVTTCGAWTVADLAGHVGQVHRLAAAVARTGLAGEQDAPVPGHAELVEWLADGLDDLVAALTADPDRPCWTFAGPATVRWWQRRQALETLVHRIDAERTVGTSSPVDPELAADGVAEVVEVMHPRQVRLGRCAPPPTGLVLHAEDTGHTSALAGPDPAVEVAGPAEALLLLLWRRTPSQDPRLRVVGDRARLDALLSAAVTP